MSILGHSKWLSGFWSISHIKLQELEFSIIGTARLQLLSFNWFCHFKTYKKTSLIVLSLFAAYVTSYHTWEKFCGEKIGKFSKLLAKFSSPLFTDTLKMYMAIWHCCVLTDCSLFTKFFLANSFTCMVRQNFPPPNVSHVRYLAIFTNAKHYKLSLFVCLPGCPLPASRDLLSKLHIASSHVSCAIVGISIYCYPGTGPTEFEVTGFY